MKKLSSKETLFVRNILLTVVLGGLIGFLNYLFNIYVARYTSETIFGIFSASMGIIYLLQIPAISIQTILTKTVGQQKDVSWNGFKLKSFLIFSILGILFSTLFYIFRDSVVSIANIPKESILPLTLVFFFAFITPIPKGILLGKEKIISVNLLLLLETIAKFVIGYIGIKMGGDINILILSNALPGIVFGLIALFLIKKENIESKKKHTINYSELGLITLSFLLISAPYTLDLILVNPLFRAEYSALTLIGKVVFFASTTISSVMFARLVNQKKDSNEVRTLLISLLTTLLIGFGISLFLFVFKNSIAELVFNSKYNGIASLMPLYGVCMTLYAFVYMSTNYLISKGSYWFISIFFSITVLQIFLFDIFNNTLNVVIRNQIILYVLLFFLICLNLYININFKKKINDKNK